MNADRAEIRLEMNKMNELLTWRKCCGSRDLGLFG